jgi:orotate phosphoribosyltransferase
VIQSGFLDSPYDISETLANGLLQIGAVEIRPDAPFTWSSGWLSPIYCDNRLVLNYPLLRTQIINAFQSIVEKELPGVDVIAGAATGGIAHAALLADRLGARMAYVRSSAKGHGKQKQVEGKVNPHDRVVVIEDTLSTGKSAYDVVEAITAEGAQVLAVCAIFSYDFDVLRERIEATGVPAYRLLSYPKLIACAEERGYISKNDIDLLLKWRERPEQFQR